MKNFKIVISISLFLLVAACSKKENQAPQLTINSPTDNQTFAAGATVNVGGTATDDKALHEAAVRVIAPAEDTILVVFPTVHSEKSYPFNYPVVVTNTGSYKAQVIFSDHDGAEVKKEVTFTVN